MKQKVPLLTLERKTMPYLKHVRNEAAFLTGYACLCYIPNKITPNNRLDTEAAAAVWSSYNVDLGTILLRRG